MVYGINLQIIFEDLNQHILLVGAKNVHCPLEAKHVTTIITVSYDRVPPKNCVHPADNRAPPLPYNRDPLIFSFALTFLQEGGSETSHGNLLQKY